MNRADRRRNKPPKSERLVRENTELRTKNGELRARVGELEAILAIALPCLECDGTTHPLPVDFYTYECDACMKQFPREILRNPDAKSTA